MSIQKFTVSKDDNYYEAFPDVVLTDGGKLISVFAECTHHGDRSFARIVKTESSDRGRTWSPKEVFVDNYDKIPEAFWNCPRISKLRDGSLAIIVDLSLNKTEGKAENHYWLGDPEGKSWKGPFKAPCDGIVPDKLIETSTGRWITSSHIKDSAGHIKQSAWYSDDRGKTWSDRVVVADKPGLKLCEGSILELPGDGTLVCFLRENSGLGLDCYKAISKDNGETWEGPFNVPMPGCHRPVAGLLDDRNVMITHRFMHGGKGWVGYWTQNFFAGFTTVESCRASKREEQSFRIMPLDYDRSPVSDIGYSGWVRFPDGEIYAVYYIVDDSPNGQIRGISFREEDVMIGGLEK